MTPDEHLDAIVAKCNESIAEIAMLKLRTYSKFTLAVESALRTTIASIEKARYITERKSHELGTMMLHNIRAEWPVERLK